VPPEREGRDAGGNHRRHGPRRDHPQPTVRGRFDHQRYNFQFSGQAYHEVRNGKIVGMLKDVA